MTDAIAAFHFLRPEWLLLLAPALGLWWLERRQADETAAWRAVMDPVLLARLSVGENDRHRLEPADVLLAGLVLAVLAAAGPTWRQEPSPFAPAARPAMFVLKVTPSMQEKDLAPSRLDRARLKMRDLLALREGAPTGLIAYAGSSHLVLPPTADGTVVAAMADALSPDIMPRQGDALPAALDAAATLLAEAGNGGSIVVFADEAPPMPAGRSAVPVFLYAALPPQRAAAEPSLRAAAGALGASLVVPTIDGKDMADLARHLAVAGPPPRVAGEEPRWQEAGWWLTIPLALLVLGWFRRGWGLA